VLQAPEFHRPPFDFLTFEQDGLPAAGVDIGRGEVFQVLVIALMVVVADERVDLRFKVSGQEVIFQQDPVLQSLVPAFDLALRLRVIWRAARVLHALVGEIFGEVARYVGGPLSDNRRGR
jgi:hypothetical protein